MTTILSIPVSQIMVRDRQRKEYGNLEELAESIMKYGQLQNVLVEPADTEGVYALIAGGRRLAGCVAAGLTEVTAKIFEHSAIDDLLRKELELEENVRRKDLTWQEREAALAEMHGIKTKRAQAEGRTWETSDTAKMLGVSQKTVQRAVAVTAAIKVNPQIAQASSAHGANQQLAKLKDLENRQTAVKLRKLAEEKGMRKPLDVEFREGDALELMRTVESESQDFVITNPPFGVDIEQVFKGDKTIYDDEPEEIAELCKGVIQESFRVLKPNRWLVLFYPTLKLEEARTFLAAAGFKFQKVPSIWYKPNKVVGSLGSPDQQLVIQYESFFFARKGDARFHTQPKHGNVFVYDTPPSSRIHPLQMPPELWEEILSLITIRGERGVEPFSGSGAGGVASIRRDLNYLGFELNPQYASGARIWCDEELHKPSTSRGPTLTPVEEDDEIPFE